MEIDRCVYPVTLDYSFMPMEEGFFTYGVFPVHGYVCFVFLSLAVFEIPLEILKNYATLYFFASSFVSMNVMVSFLVKESNHAFLFTTNMKAFLGMLVMF
jgi:hypothetical protein